MSFYSKLASQRDDSPELRNCVEETVRKLTSVEDTSVSRPGILLGRIQSGKTRAFLGIIASAFDEGFDIAIILTKNSKPLVQQTVVRVEKDFADFIESDSLRVFDIMQFPSNLTSYETNRKLILVAKKEDDNLRRILNAFENTYPALADRRILIVDDEADYASVSFRKTNGVTSPGVVAGGIDQLQRALKQSTYLQVTATPYALYLQPNDEVVSSSGVPIFMPKRPAFTVLLPIHAGYVGGEYYFDAANDETSPAFHFYIEVPDRERDALRKPDKRRIPQNPAELLKLTNTAVVRRALMNFVVGGVIRRWQQEESGQTVKKFSLLFHTETSKESHQWQKSVLEQLRDAYLEAAKKELVIFEEQCQEAYNQIRTSLELGNLPIPPFDLVKQLARRSFIEEHLLILTVNSDEEIDQQLDKDGQLKLRTPLTVFVGGQVLDRGVTITNLIGFYYGRNPKTMQQDTVLQHCRMFGARDRADLPVTRFYAPKSIYARMKQIHEFDSALREAFEKGAHDKGVYFIRRGGGRQLIPCSPNKLSFSTLNTVRPGERLLPVGMNTVAKTYGTKGLAKLDASLDQHCPNDSEVQWIDLADAETLFRAAYELFEPDSYPATEVSDTVAALHHYAQSCEDDRLRGKVGLVCWRNRDIARVRADGRYANSPDTKQQADLARSQATSAPLLMMFRQNGLEDQGWKGLPFWWPIVVAPVGGAPVVFADQESSPDPAAPTVLKPRAAKKQKRRKGRSLKSKSA